MARNLMLFLILLSILAIVLVSGKKETKIKGLRAYEIIHANQDSNVTFITYPAPVARTNPKDSERYFGFDVFVSNGNGCVASILLSYEVNKDGSVRKDSATASVISPCLR